MQSAYYFAVVLSSRPVDYERCGLNYLTKRYSKKTRLLGAPAFSGLPSLYSGSVSYGSKLNIYMLKFVSGRIENDLVASFSSSRKIQHACFIGQELLVCFEDSLEVWSNWLDKRNSHVSSTINDNWFAGLHTVFPLGKSLCVISSSAADAVMVVDLKTKSVISRFRLPEHLYGVNYDLSESDSLKDHYIPNDLQLGHLNCGFPDEDQNIWISTLIQGDIGVFDASGNYKRVMTGFVGAHGVRRIDDYDQIYFSDSCLGTLVIANLRGQIIKRYVTSSNWMHDAQHIQDDFFIFGLSDLGVVLVANIATGEEVQFPIPKAEGYIQFFCLQKLGSE